MTPQEYLEAHSLNLEFVTKLFGISISPKQITIPIYDGDGKLLFNKYRMLEGDAKFISDSGTHPALFGLHLIKNKDWLVLCEGEPDCMRLWQERIPAVTSTGGVNKFDEEMAEKLRTKEVYLCLDTDRAGKDNIEKIGQKLAEAGAIVKVLELPEAYKDVSEFFTKEETAKTKFEDLMIGSPLFDEWQTNHEPENFKWETAKDLLNEEFPKEEWLVDRILPIEGFCFIAGPEACGKSFYTLTLANAVTTGKAWLDKFIVNKKVKVLFVDKENTRRRTNARMKGLGITDDGGMIFRVKYPHFFNLVNEKGEFSDFAKSLSRKVKLEGIGLMIVDSFTDVMVGNENSQADTQAFFDSFRQLFPGVSILVLHHSNKPSQGVQRTSSQRFRGSSNITAQIYSGFFVQPVTGVNNEFIIEQTKSGDAPKIQKFKVQLVSKICPDDNTKTYVEKLMYAGEVIDEEAKLVEGMKVINELFEESESYTRQELQMACMDKDISRRTVDRVLTMLVNDETLEKEKQGRKTLFVKRESNLYRLNDDE